MSKFRDWWLRRNRNNEEHIEEHVNCRCNLSPMLSDEDRGELVDRIFSAIRLTPIDDPKSDAADVAAFDWGEYDEGEL